MHEFNEIDQIFNENAKHFEAEVSEFAWSKISNSLAVNLQRKRLVWRSNVAAFLIFGLSTLLIVSNLPESSLVKKSNIISQTKTTNTKTNQAKLTSNQTASKQNILVEKSEKVNHNQTISTKNDIQNRKIPQSESKEISNNVLESIPKPDNLISDNAISISDSNQEKSNRISSAEPEIVEISPKDSAVSSIELAKNNTESSNASKTLQTGAWYKIFHPKLIEVSYALGASYNYRNKTKTDNEVKTVVVANEDDWLNTWSNQFLVHIQYNNRIKFSSGVKFGSFGNISNFEVNDAYLAYLNVDEFGMSSAGIISGHRINNVISNSSSTNISNLHSFDRIKFQFHYLDFPVNVAYELPLSTKFFTEFGVGLNVMNVYSNEVSLRKSDEWYTIGNVTNLRQYLFGGNLNCDLLYTLPFGFSAMIGVNYQATFNSVNLDENYVYRPYLITFKGGLRFRF